MSGRDEASTQINRVSAALRGTATSMGTVTDKAAAIRGSISTVATSLGALAGIAAVGLVAEGMSRAADSVRKVAGEMERLAQLGEDIENLAQKTGISVQAIQGLSTAAVAAGTSVDALRVGVRFLNRNIAEGDPNLRKIGITTDNTREAFMQLADVFNVLPDGAHKTAIAIATLGRSGTELIPVLNKGSQELLRMEEVARFFGATISDVSVKALAEMDDKIDTLKIAFNGLRLQIAIGVVPAAQAVVDTMTNLSVWFGILPQLIGVATTAVQAWWSAWDFKSGEDPKTRIKAVHDAVMNLKDRVKESQAVFESTKPTIFQMLMQQAPDVQAMLQSLSTKSREFLEGIGASPTQIAALKNAFSFSGKDVSDKDKLIKAVGETFHMTAQQAAQLVDQYERLKSVSQAVDLAKFMTVGPEVPESVKRLSDRVDELAQKLQVPTARARELALALQAAESTSLAESIVAQLDPEKFAKAGSLRSLAESFGYTAKEARELFLRMLDIGTVPVDEGGLKYLMQLNEMLVQLKKKASESAAVRSLEPLLLEPTTPIGKKRDITGMLNQDSVETFRKSAEAIMTQASILRDTLAAVFEGLQSGFLQVFTGLLGSSQTFGRAIATIFRTMANQILAEISRIVASKLFTLFIKLVKQFLRPSPVDVATSMIPIGETPIGITEGSSAGRLVDTQSRGGNTYIIQSISARDALMSLTQPGGELRTAADRVATAGAF